ncbi:MAG: hypothetical protein DWH79_06260 [Planctomycetota bacterium]|nr:MAG: hypothetical protein DWH79_06260 [Planctomycetota bacterium]
MLDSPSAMWHGWVQRSREDAAKAVKDIKADWDLHDGEGVEAFGGGATEQLREMRGEMDRSATMSTY